MKKWKVTLGIGSLTACIIGCIAFNQFNLLLPVGVLWIAWLKLLKEKLLWLEATGRLVFANAVSFTFLALLQIFLVFTIGDALTEMPKWLMTIDDILIWCRENLEFLGEWSLTLWLVASGLTLLINQESHKWSMDALVKFREGLSKGFSIIVLITSFTFFAPYVADIALDKVWKKRFEISFRENVKQQKCSLLVSFLIKELEKEAEQTPKQPLNFFAESLRKDIKFLQQDQQTLPLTPIEISVVAEQDAGTIMNWDAEIREFANGSASVRKDQSGFSTDDYTASVEQSEKIDQQRSSEIWETKKSGSRNWARERKIVVENEEAAVLKSKSWKEDAVKVFKGSFDILTGGLAPQLSDYVSVYAGEFIATLGEYAWNAVKVEKLINKLLGKVEGSIAANNLFGKTMQILRIRNGKKPEFHESSTDNRLASAKVDAKNQATNYNTEGPDKSPATNINNNPRPVANGPIPDPIFNPNARRHPTTAANPHLRPIPPIKPPVKAVKVPWWRRIKFKIPL